MKKLLTIIILIVLSKVSFAQTPQPPFSSMTNGAYNFKHHVLVDSLFFLGVRDTLITPYRAGTLVVWQHDGVDTTVWLYDGFKWKTLGDGGGGGGGTITADNGLTMSTATNAQWGGTLIQETTISADHNAIHFDNTDWLSISGTVDTATASMSVSAQSSQSIIGVQTTNINSNLDIQPGQVQLEVNNASTGRDMVLSIYDTSMSLKVTGTSLFNINNLGSARLPQYGSGTFTGTPTFTLGVDASGNIIETTGSTSTGLTRQIITSGSSGTVTGGNYIVTFDPASTLAAYTLTLPASPSDLDIVEVDFGGTVTSGLIVTALTISPNSGQTILDNTPPVSATADNTLFYRYRASNTKWYRFKP